MLARHFADRQCEQNQLPPVDFTSDALDFLSSLPYPGNIRELKNLVKRTLLVSGKTRLTEADFRLCYQQPVHNSAAKLQVPQGMTLEEIEKQTILQAMKECGNNLSQVAALLGISRGALYRRLEKYNLPVGNS